MLVDNRDKVEAMAAALLEMETIDADQINDIMAGLPVRDAKPRQGKANPPATGAGGSAPHINPTPQPTAKSESQKSD